MPPAWTTTGTGLTLLVRVTTKALKTAVTEIVALPNGQSALGVRLAAAPVEGAANAALIAFLGKTLGLPKAGIRIINGKTSRLKRLELTGDPAVLAERLAQMARSE